MESGQALQQRARRHAALGEPVRLAIVDRLIVSDASPGELCAAFDVPTNLMAHHLRVLQDAGLIRRVRSEGDRRRSYVQVSLDDPGVVELLPPAPVLGPAERVLFVCTHNSARSQLAAAVWADLSPVPGASAGTDPAAGVHPLAMRTGRRHGLRMAPARTSNLREVARPGDLIVAVCDRAHEELPATLPGRQPPVRAAQQLQRLHWAVPDPAGSETEEAFEVAYQQISRRIVRLANAVTPIHPPASHEQGA